MSVIAWIDLRLLWAMLRTKEMAKEWLSIGSVRFERGLVLLYVGAWAVAIVRDRVAHESGFAHAYWWVVVPMIVAPGMWLDTRKPNGWRIVRLLSTAMMAIRVVLVLVAMVFCTPDLLEIRSGWHHVLLPIVNYSYAAFQFAICLPKDETPGGRKRKLALDKVKEMFGTSWMPRPVEGV